MPMPPASPDPTVLLGRLDDPDAVEALFPRVYDELRQIAARQLRRARPGQTLNTTALVHEAYLKLVDAERVRWEDRAHFYALSARAMRQVVLNHARDRRAIKRGGDARRTTLDDRAGAVPPDPAGTLVDLDRAVTDLAALDARAARVVELRFYGGMSEEEIGHVLGVSARTVRREWRQARAWLAHRLEGPTEAGGWS